MYAELMRSALLFLGEEASERRRNLRSLVGRQTSGAALFVRWLVALRRVRRYVLVKLLLVRG